MRIQSSMFARWRLRLTNNNSSDRTSIKAIEEEELSMASNDMKTSEMRALPA